MSSCSIAHRSHLIFFVGDMKTILETLQQLVLQGQNKIKEISVAASSVSDGRLTTILGLLRITLSKNLPFPPSKDVTSSHQEQSSFTAFSWGSEGETSKGNRAKALKWLQDHVAPPGVLVIDVNSSAWLDTR